MSSRYINQLLKIVISTWFLKMQRCIGKRSRCQKIGKIILITPKIKGHMLYHAILSVRQVTLLGKKSLILAQVNTSKERIPTEAVSLIQQNTIQSTTCKVKINGSSKLYTFKITDQLLTYLLKFQLTNDLYWVYLPPYLIYT